MAGSQKEAASTSKSQKNDSLLDEEIGKDFLSSWKSMSMAEDDVLDFNSETIPKARGSTFSFGKLDMDFSLDGDFGKKISSFKVDMSDLDFPSPPKKLVNPKERTRQESSSGKLEGKQDSFTFAFNFDELNSFDLHSSVIKGKMKSEKFGNDKRSDFPVKNAEKQDSRRKLVASNEAIETKKTNKLGTLEHVDSKFECLTGSFGNLDSASDGSPSIPETFGNLNASHGKNAPPHKEVTDSAIGIDQCNKQSLTETNGQDIKYSSVQPAIDIDASQGSVQELQIDIFSSATEVNAIPGGEQDNGIRQIDGLEAKLVNSSNLDDSPLTCIAGSHNSNNEFKRLENQNGAPLGSTNVKESIQCDKAMARVSQKIPHITLTTMEKKTSGSKLPLAQSLSGPKVHKHMLLRENGLSSICSQFFKGSEETGSQLNKTSLPKPAHTLSNKRNENMHQCLADARRQDANAGDSKYGNQKVHTSNSSDSSAAERSPVLLGMGSVKKKEDHNASAGFQVHSAGSPKKATKVGTLKCINSELLMPSIALAKNFKNNSVGGSKPSPLEAGKKTLHITDLKVSRCIAPNNNPLNPRAQKEIKSQWQSEGNNTMHVDTAGKMVHAVNTDKQGFSSPSMKRKKSEEPNADPLIQHPLKRITGLPNESRKPLEDFEKDKKQICDSKNLLEAYHSTSILHAPQDACLTELEVPILMKNDGNVQKAEASAKELDDICNMLKKKQEEAKEILVCAIVNNNNLLMLNHPIYEEKNIRNIQRFAAHMKSRVLRA